MNSDGSINVIWSDFGGVLTSPVAPTMEAFCRRRGISREKLLKAMMDIARELGVDDPMEPIDRPLISENIWLRRLEKLIDVVLPSETLAEVWFKDRSINKKWCDELSSLRRQGYFIGMLSNMPPAWDAYWRKMVNPNDLFDYVILSHEFELRKPERNFFLIAEMIADSRFCRNILIDDLEKNCEGARAAGWEAVHFVSTEQAIMDLHSLIG
jgi:hypothetical protein